MLALHSPLTRATFTPATILALSVLLCFGVALVLGYTLEKTWGGTYDQVSYDALA